MYVFYFKGHDRKSDVFWSTYFYLIGHRWEPPKTDWEKNFRKKDRNREEKQTEKQAENQQEKQTENQQEKQAEKQTERQSVLLVCVYSLIRFHSV